MGHGAGRVEAGEAGTGRRRGTDAAADDRGVVKLIGDLRMHVPRAEADDGFRRGGLDDHSGGGRPAGRLRHHPEDRRLVEPERAIPRADPEHDLLRLERVAVVERFDDGFGLRSLAEHVREQHLGLVDAAQDPRLAREDLHDHDRVHAFAREDLLRPGEVDVSRVARQHLDRRAATLHHDALH